MVTPKAQEVTLFQVTRLAEKQNKKATTTTSMPPHVTQTYMWKENIK